MAELAAVLAALAGKGGTPTKAAASPRPLSPSAGRPGWFVPPHLLRLPAVRGAAFTAHDCSREAASNPNEFQSVYRYGLSLQVSGLPIPASYIVPMKLPCGLLTATLDSTPPPCGLLTATLDSTPPPPPAFPPLQELASKLQQPADQLSLLHQAAEVYMEASRLQEGHHAAALCK
jgi:hypothetical protein